MSWLNIIFTMPKGKLTSVLPLFFLLHQAATIDVLSESGVKVEPLVSSRVNFHSLSQQFEDGYVHMSYFSICIHIYMHLKTVIIYVHEKLN